LELRPLVAASELAVLYARGNEAPTLRKDDFVEQFWHRAAVIPEEAAKRRTFATSECRRLK
jgi:hypothetical protein